MRFSKLAIVMACAAGVAASVPDVSAGSVDFAARAELWIECFDAKAFREVKGWAETGNKRSSGTKATSNKDQWCLIYPAQWPYGEPAGAKYLDVWSSGGTQDKPRGIPIWVQVGAKQRVLCTGLEKFTAEAPLQTGWFAKPVCK